MLRVVRKLRLNLHIKDWVGAMEYGMFFSLPRLIIVCIETGGDKHVFDLGTNLSNSLLFFKL